MSRATFKILFYLKRNAPKKNGLIPVMCRITVNGKIAQFSCRLDVEEKMWSVETGRRGGKDVERGNRTADRKEQRGSGRQPYAGQNPRGCEQGLSGRVRP